jgi:ribonuclease BN (tRNA processing enzyme)
MTATITFYPLGNADCTRIDMKDGRKLLVDYANMGCGDPASSSIDLPRALRDDLRAAQRDYFDIILFTHLDEDHTKGAGDFLHFDRFSSRQDDGRIKMRELWVPAAAITEEGCLDDAQTIRQEARHRFIKGSGVRIFSRPERLREFCERNNIRLEERLHLITNAGELVRGFDDLNAPGGLEIFIHNPMAWRLNDREVEERNEDAVVFQAVFREGLTDTKVLFASDVNADTLSHVVQASKAHGHADRLRWHVFKIAHHGSYKSLNCTDKGVDKTTPIEDVRWLCEDQAESHGIMVSTSDIIPGKGSARDADPQPPHRQAAAYYEDVAAKIDGQFEVTMHHSPLRNPKPCQISITAAGASFVAIAAMPGDYAAATTMRAG